MYKYTPKPDRRPALLLSATLFIAALALFVPYNTDAAETLIFLRGMGTCAFVLGFIIADRFVFTLYSYAIDASDSGYEFTVHSVRYGRIRTVCRVTDEMIKDIYRYEAKRARAEKIRKYNYCPEMSKKNRYSLYVDDGKAAFIFISPDETTVNIIKNIINRK